MSAALHLRVVNELEQRNRRVRARGLGALEDYQDEWGEDDDSELVASTAIDGEREATPYDYDDDGSGLVSGMTNYQANDTEDGAGFVGSAPVVYAALEAIEDLSSDYSESGGEPSDSAAYVEGFDDGYATAMEGLPPAMMPAGKSVDYMAGWRAGYMKGAAEKASPSVDLDDEGTTTTGGTTTTTGGYKPPTTTTKKKTGTTTGGGVTDTEDEPNYLAYGLIGAGVLLGGGVLYAVVKRRKKRKQGAR